MKLNEDVHPGKCTLQCSPLFAFPQENRSRSFRALDCSDRKTQLKKISSKATCGLLFGWRATAGIECMLGSAMYLKSTGMSLKKELNFFLSFFTQQSWFILHGQHDGCHSIRCSEIFHTSAVCADICGHDSNYLIIAITIMNIIIIQCCWCSVPICFTYHSQTRILLSSDVVTNLLF